MMPSKDEATFRANLGKQFEQPVLHERQKDEAQEDKEIRGHKEFSLNPQVHEYTDDRDLDQPKIHSFDFYNDFDDDFDDSDLS